MAIYSALTLGVTVIGGPFVGWVCGQWSPRVGLGVAGAATAAGALGVVLVQRARLLEPEHPRFPLQAPAD
jgi:hypothetical protein